MKTLLPFFTLSSSSWSSSPPPSFSENWDEKHTAREIVQSCFMQHFSNTRKMISVKKSSSKNTSKNNLAKKESSIKKPVKEKALQTFHLSTFDHWDRKQNRDPTFHEKRNFSSERSPYVFFKFKFYFTQAALKLNLLLWLNVRTWA